MLRLGSISRLCATPQTVACQAPLPMRFSRQEYWSGLPFPSPGIFPTQGLNTFLLIGSQILYCGATRESPEGNKSKNKQIDACMLSCSIMSDSLWPHGLQPARLLCPWVFPVKNTGVGSHFLLQGSFWPRDWTQVSCTTGRFFTIWATREAQERQRLRWPLHT